MHESLVEVLERAQRLGALGGRPIAEVLDHARCFVDALVDVRGVVVDLGSGGGIPGLVIAHDRPDLHLVLVDRRTSRTDELARAVRRLGWTDRVEVVSSDVEEVVRPGHAAAVAPHSHAPRVGDLGLPEDEPVVRIDRDHHVTADPALDYTPNEVKRSHVVERRCATQTAAPRNHVVVQGLALHYRR